MSMSFKKVGSLIAALALAGFMTGCSGSSSSDSSSAADTSTADASAAETADDSGDAGFQEEPVGDEVFSGPLKIAAVYFQPVEMTPKMGVDASQAAMHLEADITAVEDNQLGYGAGDFVPGLTVEYAIKDASDNEVQSGTFMTMNASDGPHYGLNLPELAAGDYTLEITIHSPEENGWMLHTDDETGVEGRFWTEPIVATFPDWHWDPEAVWW
ncbi:MAG: amino acid ABC transporter substrate-binding protein [Propionibacteriaceae bacterium]|uniref:Fe2+ transport protein n=1 Tax=Propionibacterium ruminifibrarum TaxID=1962131 RepID=A0A375I1T6_9ACTN|nr:iron transporter [Propionibacterium ruminifibrarum]MBE6478231.1 amino acid ABC transporter substrate-binding protein [Propionibacteriaceae bacterium]SPF68772.1 Fe2+ transport protein [Propionibacterium ruminifibrarum]